MCVIFNYAASWRKFLMAIKEVMRDQMHMLQLCFVNDIVSIVRRSTSKENFSSQGCSVNENLWSCMEMGSGCNEHVIFMIERKLWIFRLGAPSISIDLLFHTREEAGGVP
ncbi:hypothetical protein SADUNF_Sadunf08G0176700 [Salix dunnii]|uniref:Uncharacterized protein n=1 Tax=Salix dunnii TaxID=1413687 RepID=A0A835K0T6_9ROSI|nr:hypothetical protein SADUNF_Sadunf08G0176700 [Salix dunnii]